MQEQDSVQWFNKTFGIAHWAILYTKYSYKSNIQENKKTHIQCQDLSLSNILRNN